MKFVYVGYTIDERQDVVYGFQENPGFEELYLDVLVLLSRLFSKGYTMTRAKETDSDGHKLAG